MTTTNTFDHMTLAELHDEATILRHALEDAEILDESTSTDYAMYSSAYKAVTREINRRYEAMDAATLALVTL